MTERREPTPNETYGRRVLRFAWYVRYTPLLALAPGILFALVAMFLGAANNQFGVDDQWSAATLHQKIGLLYLGLLNTSSRALSRFIPAPLLLALFLVFGFIVPAYLVLRSRSARPETASGGSASPWPIVSGLALLAAAAVYVAAVFWWFWDPPCRSEHAGYLALGRFVNAGIWPVATVNWGLLWIARAVLVRKSRLATIPAPRLHLLERITLMSSLAVVALFFLLVIAPFFPGSQSVRYESLLSEASLNAIRAQEEYVGKTGRYADNLPDLLTVDPLTADTPGVTFIFGYAGETRFTFTTVHPNACRPQIRNN